jgi:hypothetical protein
MNFNCLLFTGFLIVSLWSCRKDEINSVSAISLIKTLYNTVPTYPDYFEKYTYDEMDRLKLIIKSTGDSVVMEYTDTLIGEYQYDSTGYLFTTNLYFLNLQGLVDSSILENGHLNIKTIYDSGGYPSVKKYYYQGGMRNTEFYTIANGNIILKETMDTFGVIFYREEYSYELNKLNSIGASNFGQAYLGKSSVNFLSHLITFNPILPGKTDYFYTCDSLGRISEIVSKVGDRLLGTSNFTYY